MKMCRTTTRIPFQVVITILICMVTGTPVNAYDPFRFESVQTLDDMHQVIRDRLPLGTHRTAVRAMLVAEGQATQKTKEGHPAVEKYLYDMDLCHYYIWRWNISADYDANDKLLQAYVNGNIVFQDGSPKRVVPTVAANGKKASIYKVFRPRPEAYKGESRLAFLMLDLDSDIKTTDDQAIAGAGPSRADPTDMGKVVAYTDVELWRSIFDFDVADHIAEYKGNCMLVDRAMEQRGH